MKKIYFLISTLMLLFISFLIVIITPKNYTLSYKIDNLDIEEKYNKKDKIYYYTITYKNLKYPLIISKKYIKKRKLIDKIQINENNNETCINAHLNSDVYYICSEDENLKSLNTMSKEFLEKNYNIANNEPKQITKYNNIIVYNNDYKYLIWNYKGFYQIDDNKSTNLDIFKKDNYKNYLSYQTDKYLIFPDYDSEYYFNKIYIYNTETNTLNNINFSDDISYDSYFLGDENNKLYFIDKKNKIEYEINLKKTTIKQISEDNNGKYFNGVSWEDKSITNMVNNEMRFNLNNTYKYYLKDNVLYLNINNYNIKITNLNVKKIVYVNDDEVFYLSENKLYKYKYHNNETILLEYDEWNFNYNNHIFIFN